MKLIRAMREAANTRKGLLQETKVEIGVGGDPYDMGVVYIVKVDGKKVESGIRDGDHPIKLFGKKFDTYKEVEDFVKNKFKVSSVTRYELE